MNGVIYTRVSSDEQVKGMSLSFQREDCSKYAKEQKIKVLKTFVEEGESAKFANRPKLTDLLDFCRARKNNVQVVIVWKLDRLSRDQMDYYYIKRSLRDKGVSLRSVTEPALENSASMEARIFETFSALQAELDNTIRRDRAIRGMSAKIQSGIYPWHPPLGYLSARNRLKGLKKTEPDKKDPDRFHRVQGVFHYCLENSISGNVALARTANKIGLTSLQGKEIYPQIIDRMMANRYYCGILTDPWSKEDFEGKHEALISQLEFNKVQRVRSSAPGSFQNIYQKINPDFPLRGTILCSACKGPMTGSWSRGNGGRYAYYHCSQKGCVRYGKGEPKVAVEGGFRLLLKELSLSEGAAILAVAFLKDLIEGWNDDQERNAEAAAKAVALAEEQKTALFEMRERNLIDDEEFLLRKREIDLVLIEQKSNQKPLALQNGWRNKVEHLMVWLTNLDRWWEHASIERKVRFQKYLFPAGISYSREYQFGTAKEAPTSSFMREMLFQISHLVHPASEFRNQFWEEYELLCELTADYSKDLIL